MRTLTLTLGAILVAYGLAGALSEAFWLNDEQVSRVLCGFLLCDDTPLVQRARDQMTGGKGEDIQQAITTFRTVLQQDTQDPYRWVDLGDAFLEARQKEDARYCFDQVLVLAPRTPELLLRVADFYFGIGQNQEALRITARILALIPDDDPVIFNEYIRNTDRTEDVLRLGLSEDPRAAKSWLQFLIQAGRLDGAQRTWDWFVGRGYTDDALAGEYVEFLIRQGHPDSAASAWIQHLGARSGDYRKSNYLYNGDFEAEPTQSPFDWKVARAPGVEVTRDCTTVWSGKCSLRISFEGSQNLDFAAISQLAFVPSCPYRFQAFIRTEGLTTDQGLRFRISDAETPAHLNMVFGHYTGSTPWSLVQYDFAVPAQTKLLRIQIIRQASVKFDNKVGGTAWIDDLRLEPLTSRH